MSDAPPDDELGSMASLLTAMAATGPRALLPGTVVGDQYRIERPLGEGGMGVVYLARDTRLARDVAVKLGNAVSRSALRRIEREAQALARFSHPNVVVVYQVGELDGRVFIAMEHVDGGTARAWLTAAPRTWREVVALYAAAGDGLAAAHAAGLIHRDFKPDNVLVGRDGRPRVADFGLARPAERDRADGDATLTTQTGAVVGTPAYMPPEQRAGEVLDARADQYAFAAALWEALFRALPFGVVEPAPRVPRHIVAALRRALEPDRADRWPEMAALLAELRRDPHRRLKRAGLVAAGVALAGAATAAVMLTGGSERAAGPAPCSDGPARMAAIWNPVRRDALAAKVGAQAWTPVAARLDARAALWVEQWDGNCRAARVDLTISDALRDRRVLCLEERHAELDAVLRALEQAGRDAAIAAPALLDGLPSPVACQRPALASDEEPPPTDAESQRLLAASQATFADARAAALDSAQLERMGRVDAALAIARSIGWRPLIARAYNLRASVLYDLGRYDEARVAYDEAAPLALASRSDHLVVEVMAGSAWVLADLGRLGEARRALDTARSMWTRTGEPPETGVRLWHAIAHVAMADDRPHDAVAATRQHMALARQLFGDDAASLSKSELNLSVALLASGDLVEAAAASARAIAHGERAYGDHPNVADLHGHAATVARVAGALEVAQRHAERALAIDAGWYAADDYHLIDELVVLGEVARQRGDLDGAVTHFTRALAIERGHDPASRQIPMWETNLAIVAAGRGDFDEAGRRGAAALAAMETTFGPDADELINALVLTGYVARHRTPPDLEASRRDLQRAHDLAIKKLGAVHGDTLNTAIELSHTQVALGRAADAVALLTPWLERVDSPQLAAHQPAELRYALADALAAAGNRGRACVLAAEAETGYRALGIAPMADEVVAWRKRTCR